MNGPTIQALETGDETWYVLRRPGLDDVYEHWPHALVELEPAAVRLAYTGDRLPPSRTIAVSVGPRDDRKKLYARPSSSASLEGELLFLASQQRERALVNGEPGTAEPGSVNA